jgi:hypothetical protein
MGWRRDRYERRQRISGRDKALYCERDGRDFILEDFVFRPHFFEGYVERVADPLVAIRTIEEMARIAAHSIRESELPERIPLDINFNLLVQFHTHDETGIEVPFSLNYVPIRRDKYDLASGRICAVTVMEAEEKWHNLAKKFRLSS